MWGWIIFMVNNFYMSFWNCYKYTNPKFIECFNLSFELLKKHNYNVHLVTDNRGKESLKHLKWDSINTDLNNLDLKYKYVWSLGKILTYNIASKKHESFIHIDADFFMFEPLDEKFLNSEILVHNTESSHIYKFDIIKNNCGYLPEELNIIPKKMYNMSIFGGKSKTIEKYSENALDFVLNEKNLNYFTNEKFFDTLTQAMIPEQGLLGCFLNQNNIQPVICCELNNLKPNKFLHCPAHKIFPENITINIQEIEKISKQLVF